MTETTLKRLRFGLELDGKALKRAQVDRLNEDQLRFVLKEGKKRQIRRMCEAVNLKVTGLKRVRLGKEAMVEITQIGKKCHNKCEIYYQAGDCIMPREGVFAKVIQAGRISCGDDVELLE